MYRHSFALLGWIVGIVLMQFQAAVLQSSSAVVLLGIGLAGLLLLMRGNARRHVWLYSAACGLCALMLGVAWASLWADARLQERLPATWEKRTLQVTGVVQSLPQAVERGQRFVLAVESTAPVVPNFPQKISLGWYEESAHAIRAAQRWRLSVRLQAPHGNANPGGFDYERWLFEEGIGATGTVLNLPQAPQKLQEWVWHPVALLQRARQSVRQEIFQALLSSQGPARYAGVLVALVLGDQRAINQDDWSLFNQTGIGHLVAISGLHITMLAGLAAWLGSWWWRRSAARLRWLPAPHFAILLAVATALGYCLLAGWGVPAQRTFWMLGMVALTLWRQRLAQPFTSLLWAAALVLALDPLAALAPGCILSFMAVAILLWLGQKKLLASLAEHSPPRPRWSSWLATLKQAASLQLAISLALAPLTLTFFQQVSWIGPFANAIAIPVISFVVTPLAMLGTLCQLVFNWAGLLHVAHAVLQILILCLQPLANLPAANYSAAMPALWATVLALVGVVWLLLPWHLPLRLLGFCLLFPAFLTPAARPPDGHWRMVALDVGQGTAVLIQTAQHTLLYDTGPRFDSNSDAAQRSLLPYLRYQGIDRLDAFVVSHRDSDHAGGLNTIWQHLPPRHFYTSMSAAELPPAIAQHPAYQLCQAGQQWEWDGVSFEFLHPAPAEDWSSTNEKSCVLSIRSHSPGMSQTAPAVLLTGDIPERVEKHLLSKAQRTQQSLQHAVLVVPHHGSLSSSSTEWIAAVRPQWAVIQAGYQNQFMHPRPQVVARYRANQAQVLETTQGGAWQFEFVPNRASPIIQAWRAQRCRYWYRVCGEEA